MFDIFQSPLCKDHWTVDCISRECRELREDCISRECRELMEDCRSQDFLDVLEVFCLDFYLLDSLPEVEVCG